MTRIIGYKEPGSGEERVYFTEDVESPTTDFITPGWEILYDETIESEMPSYFPHERSLTVTK